MDESKKVERELVAIQERQVHHQLDNSIKIDDEKSTRMWKLMMIMMNTIMMIACKSFVSFLMFTPQAAGDIYIHSLLTDLQTAETEGAELQVTIKTWLEWSFTDQDYHPTTLTSASSTGSWPCLPPPSPPLRCSTGSRGTWRRHQGEHLLQIEMLVWNLKTQCWELANHFDRPALLRTPATPTANLDLSWVRVVGWLEGDLAFSLIPAFVFSSQ